VTLIHSLLAVYNPSLALLDIVIAGVILDIRHDAITKYGATKHTTNGFTLQQRRLQRENSCKEPYVMASNKECKLEFDCISWKVN
jgi:hypothetical protein